MDYRAFFEDVLGWIGQANQAAVQYGMGNDQFWQTMVDAAGAICSKYGNHALALKQMAMMVEWLEEVYQNTNRS